MDKKSSTSATRTSKSWSSLPGNFDRLNTRALYGADNDLGIPSLPLVTATPTKLIAYNARGQLESNGALDGSCVHFFLDDYRFETMWSQPQRSLTRVTRAGMALTPDFSLWREMPLVMQQWQTYRSRWCGRWMIDHGIKVIPTVSWSTESSYSFAFAGIAQGSTVAISTVGSRSAGTLFDQGVGAMVDIVKPANMVVYGHKVDVVEQLAQGIQVHYYPSRSRWETVS